uniref:STI1 domain-containing protein n=1 Tax=Helicotheca tamesis TaxID=374047 RepID=A0A7S2HQP8_9STRA|mmetsp:Transcript_20110/g.27581  ORF Transcript_20110/g.27581 Transcript_20110/m.27581 type:complete len:211 (+) Transcript_20110:127-759(+)|eukprot:CAMPEP_0185724272 /NCGR_PEP_ID=MMETSP1171-20130828/799_1 /TAXON_ID=374046 /ORGANISM="Helicotheca tamensis, Strain CCMP826" /LENGTH=210 /DNA_ID=CAMNT_0028392085 /DNA_START=106 /DNA_END=738 /DNA_ORIENTATION=-
MKLFNALLSAGIFLLSVTGPVVNASEAKYERGVDEKADAEYDIQMGLAGLKQAANDPKLLAQLMQDLQDPKMMAEAKRMMESPEYKKQMKDLEKSKEFKDSMKKTAEMMKDPSTAARIQAQMEHMVKRGQDSMKKEAKNTMTEAMEAMGNPEAMKQAAELMKDPEFQKQMSEMAKDPSFKQYVSAMEEMMKDPATKAKVEAMRDQYKTAL